MASSTGQSSLERNESGSVGAPRSFQEVLSDWVYPESHDSDSEDLEVNSQEPLAEPGRAGYLDRFKRFLQKKQYYTSYHKVLAMTNVALAGVLYVLNDAGDAQRATAEPGRAHRANLSAVLFVANLTSLACSLVVATYQEGGFRFLRRAFSWKRISHFGLIGLLFFVSNILWLRAFTSNSAAKQLTIAVGYLYMPIAAAASQYYFKRQYGAVHWLSIFMMTCAISAFMLLRERYKECPENSDIQCGTIAAIRWIQADHSFPVSALAATFVSVTASILSERLFHHWSQEPFSVLKVNIDLAGLAAAGFNWIITTQSLNKSIQHRYNSYTTWGEWRGADSIMVAIIVCQSWSSGLVVKVFSTVTKSILATLATVSATQLNDCFSDAYKLDVRAAPSMMLIAVVGFSAWLFHEVQLYQKDKLLALLDLTKNSEIPNVEDAERHAEGRGMQNLEAERNTEGNAEEGCEVMTWTAKAKKCSPWFARSDTHAEGHFREQAEKIKEMEGAADEFGVIDTQMVLISIIYSVTDTAKTVLNSYSLSSSQINPNSMSLLSFVVGILFASSQVWWTHGLRGTECGQNDGEQTPTPDGRGQDKKGTKGLCQAWSLKKIYEYSPASALQAATMCLTNTAYALGLTAPMASVLGKVYTPVLAIGDRLFLKKHHVMLEWIAIIILTLGIFTFSYLQIYNMETGLANVLTHTMPAICSVAGAIVAAIKDLASQQIYDNNREADFYMSKVRFDAGSAVFTLLAVPLLSLIASEPKNIVWLPRPTKADCNIQGCWPKVGVLRSDDLHWPGASNEMMLTCQASNCTGACACSWGLFAGWGSDSDMSLYGFLAITVLHGILVGIISCRYGALHRAKCDAFGLLLTYWIGFPLMERLTKGVSFSDSLKDECLNVVSFIIPLAAISADFGKFCSLGLLQQLTGFRMGLVAGLFSRILRREVGVVISDADQVKGEKFESQIRLIDQPALNIRKMGPYVRLVTETNSSGILQERFGNYSEIVQELFSSLPSQQQAKYKELLDFVQASQDEFAATRVAIGVTSKSPPNHEVLMATRSGVLASAAKKSTAHIRKMGHREREMCRMAITNAMKLCKQLAEAIQDNAPLEQEDELKRMVASFAEEEVVAPFLQLVAEEE